MGAHLNTALLMYLLQQQQQQQYGGCANLWNKKGASWLMIGRNPLLQETIFSDWIRGKEHTQFYPTRGTQSRVNCGPLLKYGKAQITEYRFLYVGSFIIHSVVRLTTDPWPLPKRVLQTGRSSASSLSLKNPVFSLRSPSRFLHLLPRLPVTFILPSFVR